MDKKKYKEALVISDTHGKKKIISDVLKDNPGIDYIFHLGDYDSDMDGVKTHAKAISVRGNCDFVSENCNTEQVNILGQKIILTHGHKFGVKYDFSRLLYYAMEKEAKAILFGHTHLPYMENKEGIWLINPGSAGEPRDGEGTYAILRIYDFGIVPKLFKTVKNFDVFY